MDGERRVERGCCFVRDEADGVVAVGDSALHAIEDDGYLVEAIGGEDDDRIPEEEALGAGAGSGEVDQREG